MRAQSMLEYIILVIIVVSALASMQIYVQDRLNPHASNKQIIKPVVEDVQPETGIATVNGLLILK